MQKRELKVVRCVRNQQGIKVKKSCLSCREKVFGDTGCRICKMSQERVKTKTVCDQYVMSESLQQVGRRGAGIKKKPYLDYVLNIRLDEEEAVVREQCKPEECRKEVVSRTIEQIRRDFEKQNGSIYL